MEDEVKEAVERLGLEFDELDDRRAKLADAREKLARERSELQPVEAYVSAQRAKHDEAQRILDAEEKGISQGAKQLARDLAAAKRDAEAEHKRRLKEAAAEHKSGLAELAAVEHDLVEFQEAGAAEGGK